MKVNKVKIKLFQAPLWKRFFAYFIDLLIVNVIILPPFQKVLLKVLPTKDASFMESYKYFSSGNVDTQTILFAILGMSFFTLLYWTLLEYKIGQSIGKILLNIYAKNKENKQMMSFPQAILRNLTKVSVFTIMLDTAYMLYKKTNQRYFEKLSNTEVVEVGWSV